LLLDLIGCRNIERRFMRTSKFFAAALVTTQLVFSMAAHSEPPLWKQKSNTASGCELRKEHAKAAQLYEEALKLLPPSDLNSRAKLEASVAANLLAVHSYDRAVEMGKHAAHLAKDLKRANKLDPDVLLNLNYLQECCEKYKMSAEFKARGHELDNKLVGLSLMLRQIVNPQDPFIFDDYLIFARTYVGMHRDKEAEAELINLSKRLPPDSAKRKTVLLCIDALRAKHGQTVKYEQEFLRETKPTTMAMRVVSECKLWAADYKGAVAMLDRAKLIIRGNAAEQLKEMVEINRSYASIKTDVNDWKGAEPYFRKNIVLLSKDPKNIGKLNSDRIQLARCLREQNRLAEAEELEREAKRSRPSRKNRYDFIFTEQEQSALEKERAQEKAQQK